MKVSPRTVYYQGRKHLVLLETDTKSLVAPAEPLVGSAAMFVPNSSLSEIDDE